MLRAKNNSSKKNIFAIIGSAGDHSSNLRLAELFARLAGDRFTVSLFNKLKELPHFDTELTISNTPAVILAFRESILAADAVLICTPEYVFSIPSGLKNAIEWCVSTTVFTGKPTALITASADGKKGHEELQLIMRTIQAHVTDQTNLLIPGIKSRFDSSGNLTDQGIMEQVGTLIKELEALLNR